jgi:uncharacterized protein YecE (DUF72 family)
MHVKAFGLMTRHPVKLEALPPISATTRRPTTKAASNDRRASSAGGLPPVPERWTAALCREAWRHPLPFPSYVVYKDRSLEYLQWAREQLGDDEMLVEFRHISWLDEEHRDETLRFLEQLGATNVSSTPRASRRQEPFADRVRADEPDVYVRFHGRNAETWNKRGGQRGRNASTTCTPRRSSRSGSGRCASCPSRRSRPYAFFNNNRDEPGRRGGRMAQAAAYAKALQRLLQGGQRSRLRAG